MDGQIDTRGERESGDSWIMLLNLPLICWCRPHGCCGCMGAMLSESSDCPCGIEGRGPPASQWDTVDRGNGHLWGA